MCLAFGFAWIVYSYIYSLENYFFYMLPLFILDLGLSLGLNQKPKPSFNKPRYVVQGLRVASAANDSKYQK